jgi:TRAP-type C4-dicarboxylate transport system permease small subunit
MSQTPGQTNRASWQQSPLGALLYHLAAGFALFGGAVLLVMIGLSSVSVIGRWILDTPVQGDFELVQLGCAICVACFLPYCQVERGHVMVDFFTMRASPRSKTLLDALGALLLGASAALLTWRMIAGTLAMRSAHETSMLLGVPIWYVYAPLVAAFALLAATGFFAAWLDFRQQGRG